MLNELMERGYNAGAAAYIADQIAAGNGTLDQYTFGALDLRYVAKMNSEHGDYTATVSTEMMPTMESGIKFQRWTKGAHDRLYIKKAIGFKNRPYQDLGYLDLATGNIVPGHGQHEGSVRAYLTKAGTSIDALLQQYR